MAKNEIAVLDFGSSKISVYVAEKNVNDFFVIKSIGTCEYAGFMDGEFIEPENLENAIKCAINDAELSLPKKIKKLNIGVPTQFCICETREIGINFNTRVKIKQSHFFKYGYGFSFDDSKKILFFKLFSKIKFSIFLKYVPLPIKYNLK